MTPSLMRPNSLNNLLGFLLEMLLSVLYRCIHNQSTISIKTKRLLWILKMTIIPGHFHTINMQGKGKQIWIQLIFHSGLCQTHSSIIRTNVQQKTFRYKLRCFRNGTRDCIPESIPCRKEQNRHGTASLTFPTRWGNPLHIAKRWIF